MRRIAFALLSTVVVLSSTSPLLAAEVLLQNDGFAGGSAGFQAGFIIGELGASRFVPPVPDPVQLKKVQFLFGGASGQRTITLRIYQDTAGNPNPGGELFSGDYAVTGNDTVLQEIDLTANNVFITGGFRVGIEFQHNGTPSIARDDDGNIDAGANFLYASGFGWFQSSSLGLTGDWIIRAIIETPSGGSYTVGGNVSGLSGTLVLQNNGGDDLVINADGPFTFATPIGDGLPYDVTVFSEPAGQDCVLSNAGGTISGANVTSVGVSCSDSPGAPVVLKNDGFADGQTASFQAGFVIGEIAAARLMPSGPTQIVAVRFLYGGAAGTRSVRLYIWDDASLSVTPGTELYGQDYQVTASNFGLQEIDLSATPVAVGGPFRIGLLFYDDGVPSIARDDDGNITANRNFILLNGVTWVDASTVGVTGDWILRAVVSGAPVGADEPSILSITDVGGDQGGQVRIEFTASSQDDAASLQPVTAYEAYRRVEPGFMTPPVSDKRLAGWEFVGSVPSHGEAVYNMIAPTLADSTISEGMHWSSFFIRAATASPFTFHDSPPDSGYSSDNLAPGVPQNLLLAGDLLSWNPLAEPDLSHFRIYGSSTGAMDGSQTLLGASTAVQFSVASTPHAYYLVTARDLAGNEGAAASTSAATAVGPIPGARLRLDVAPNPFNPATVIQFELAKASRVTLRLFDARGRLVVTLLSDAPRAAGLHQLEYRSELSSGVYLLRLSAGDRVQNTKMTILR
jgi:hypothetical protein